MFSTTNCRNLFLWSVVDSRLYPDKKKFWISPCIIPCRTASKVSSICSSQYSFSLDSAPVAKYRDSNTLLKMYDGTKDGSKSRSSAALSLGYFKTVTYFKLVRSIGQDVFLDSGK